VTLTFPEGLIMGLQSAVCLMLALAAACCQAQSAKFDERGLWDLWCAGTNSAFEATEVLDACRAFRQKSPNDGLTVVIAGIEGWHHLKRGNADEARRIFSSMLVDGRAADVFLAGDKLARTWLTRMDRELVTAALRKLYLRDIAFPASLEALSALGLKPPPPLQDRWGKPWDYRLGSSISGMATQRYVLESPSLGVYSELKGALALTYAARIDLRPVRMLPNVRNSIEFRSGSGTTIVRQAGDLSGRINLAYIGSNIIVITDGNHWSVLPKPR
jgi:hypothetical protein